jgi:hypothetical protein
MRGALFAELSAFVAVADHGSFTKARAMCLSRPAISRRAEATGQSAAPLSPSLRLEIHGSAALTRIRGAVGPIVKSPPPDRAGGST